MFERMCAAELLQGPVVLTFLIARDGLDLGFEMLDYGLPERANQQKDTSI